MTNTVYDIINSILAGGLLGILGQGIRMAIGLKKLSDTNSGKADSEIKEISSARLIISLFIGFVAGALFLLIKGVDDIGKREFIFSVIAAGYSGTDFIEGLFNTYIAKTVTPAATKVAAPTPVETPQTPNFSSDAREDENTTNL